MTFISPRVIGVFGVVVVLGVALFVTSENVQKAEDELAKIEEKIQSAEKTIHVFRAEWAYLNRPQRLEVLARDYLGMDVPSPKNILQGLDDINAQVMDGLTPALYKNNTLGDDEGAEL